MEFVTERTALRLFEQTELKSGTSMGNSIEQMALQLSKRMGSRNGT
jgi:hypothetical protein